MDGTVRHMRLLRLRLHLRRLALRAISERPEGSGSGLSVPTR
jgi:hypothetical protein